MSAENWVHASYIAIFIGGVIAASGGLGSYFFKNALEKEDLTKNKPAIEIKTQKNDNKINFYIKSSNDNVTSIAIDYPIWGIVTNITDFNSITDAQTKKMDVIGSTNGYSQNNIEMLLEKIKPNTSLEFEVSFNKNGMSPEDLDLTIVDYDKYMSRYKLSYTWEYKGKKYSEMEWHLTGDDNLTIKPAIEYRDISIIKEEDSITQTNVSQRRSFIKAD
ncbi:MAG TPA: hypothetical protein VMX18_02160 [Candidatus Bipolaricaulota bacterium]|nr:hypothetical protein [Candidatus Bipolaricaulota bacterium]